ncbi:MAG: O-acetyl-ADP-ribose deacetylase [Anaerolineae bacterium]|nr:O-acetyl-ADP-ribose deacetylase [Anaerolineae bacterium]
MLEERLNNITLKITLADITLMHVDAIVNPAPSDLEMKSGLARGILARGGAAIQQEARALGYCPPGEAMITSGGALPARHVIHTVGPVMGEGNERGKLASAIWNTLKLADSRGLASIALPAISTGKHGGFPMEACAAIMAQRIVDFTFEEVASLRMILVCLIQEPMLHAFTRAFQDEISDARAEV